MSEDISEIFTIGPSEYRLFSRGGDDFVDWRIILADDSCRKLLREHPTNHKFNICALPIVGLSAEQMENFSFVRVDHGENFVTFESASQNVCISRVRYQFFDLSFRVKLQLENLSNFPIYWCPAINLGLHLPWHENLSLDQYSIHSKSKRKLILNDDYAVLSSNKCPDRLSLAELEEKSNNTLAITGMQDPKIAISTKNEEESVHVTLCGKHPDAYIGLHKTNDPYCTELRCMLDLPVEDAGDFSHYKCVASKKVGEFEIELSVF